MSELSILNQRISKAGRYGGTYAHKDIAFEFEITVKDWRKKFKFI